MLPSVCQAYCGQHLLYTVVGTGSTGTVNELVALIITHLSD